MLGSHRLRVRILGLALGSGRKFLVEFYGVQLEVIKRLSRATLGVLVLGSRGNLIVLGFWSGRKFLVELLMECS
jgi:hypothetical protein